MTADGQYPQMVIEAAKRALDNPDLIMLLSIRKKELEDDTLLAEDDKMILEAHAEHKHLIGWSEWIAHVAGHSSNE